MAAFNKQSMLEMQLGGTGKTPSQSQAHANPALSARATTNNNAIAGRATVIEKSGNIGGRKLKKNIIKQRAGKQTQGSNMFSRKQCGGLTSTQNLKTRNHYESMSPQREIERPTLNHGGSILKKSSID